jgi:hypothetical protein
MGEGNNYRDDVFSTSVRAGKRTYFFDVKATRGNDLSMTITESKRAGMDENGHLNFDRHKIFLYKEDFNKFIKGLTEAVEYVKTDLMPDFDFDAFNHDQVADGNAEHVENRESENTISENKVPENKEDISAASNPESEPVIRNTDHEEVDKW